MPFVAASCFNVALRSFLILLCACFALSAQALSVGEMTVSSAVGERFYGVAKISGAGSTDASQILVSVAPRSVYQRMGVAYDYFHSRLIFDVLSDENNELYLRIVSSDIVYEPYLDFVIALRWPSGFISKQYTVLLDMPQQLQRASQTAVQRQQQINEVALPSSKVKAEDSAANNVVVSPLPPAVSAPATAITAEAPPPEAIDTVTLPETAKALETSQQAPKIDSPAEKANSSKVKAKESEALAQAPQLPEAEPEPSVEPVPKSDAELTPETKPVATAKVKSKAKTSKTPKPAQIESELGPDAQKVWKVATQYGDTLWAIARKIKQESGGNTLDILNALHQNNPRAFINGNIDLLRADARLSVSLAQIKANNPEAFRSELLPIESQDSNAEQPTPEQVNEASETLGDENTGSKNGVLSLVAEEPDADVSEAVASLSQSLEASNAEFDAQLEKNKEQTEKIEASMDNLLDQYDALSEKTSQLKALEEKLNRSIAEKAQVEMGMAELPANALPASSPTNPNTEPFDAAKLGRTLLTWLVVIAVLGLLAALVIYAMRRWQYQRWEAEDAHWDNEIFMEGNQFEGDDRAAPVKLKGESVFIRPAEDPEMTSHIDIDLGAADGSVELQAGLFIAYQRYDDAQELLSAALEQQPNNLALKVQLLEVYSGMGDNARFEALASELEALNDPQLNNKIKGLRA